MFKCGYCAYQSDKKYNITKHLTKKKKCSTSNNYQKGNEPIFGIHIRLIENKNTPKKIQDYEKLENDKIKCLYCSKIISNINNFYRHRKHSCKDIKIINSLFNTDEDDKTNTLHNKVNEYIQNKIYTGIKEQLQNIPITFNIQNNQTINYNFNNGSLRTYGNEDISSFNPQFFDKMVNLSKKINSNLLVYYYEQIHFNEKLPQNWNILKMNDENVIYYTETGEWKIENLDKFAEKSTIDKIDQLGDHYETLKNSLDIKAKTHKYIIDFLDSFSNEDISRRHFIKFAQSDDTPQDKASYLINDLIRCSKVIHNSKKFPVEYTHIIDKLPDIIQHQNQSQNSITI